LPPFFSRTRASPQIRRTGRKFFTQRHLITEPPGRTRDATLPATERDEQIVHLITRHQRQLAVYVRSLVPQRADAEEVLQEVNLSRFQLCRSVS
jgi:hypothetical protein